MEKGKRSGLACSTRTTRTRARARTQREREREREREIIEPFEEVCKKFCMSGR